MTVKHTQRTVCMPFSIVSLISLGGSECKECTACFRVYGVGGLHWRGWGEEEEEVKNIYGSRMLTTKYPGALSVTNSNKSFSKGTVVNSGGRGFFGLFFHNCLFQINERHLQLVVCKWLSEWRKRKNKRGNEGKKEVSLLLQVVYTNRRKPPLIKPPSQSKGSLSDCFDL